MPARLSKEQFVEKARQIHSDKYDYSFVEYVNNSTHVKIVCPIHGEFKQTPNAHLMGQACPECGKKIKADKKRLSVSDFIKNAKKVHGNKYDYSLVEYNSSKSKVKIICPVHGEFEQTPNAHLRNGGCAKCGKQSMADKQSLTTETFIQKAIKVHGHKYIYDCVDYVSARDNVVIKCPIHGEFSKLPAMHLLGQGCTTCAIEQRYFNLRLTNDEFIRKSSEIHNNKYDYSLTKYEKMSTKVKIICPIHGEFEQVAGHHVYGAGCQVCGVRLSKPELEIQSLLDSLGIRYSSSDRSVIPPLELDIVIPDHNLAIEFNGLIWHSEKYGKDRHYHSHKTNLCAEKGYRLIHIWEDDWCDRKEIELAFIKQLVGKSSSDVVYARKCTVNNIDYDTASEFLNQYHIQGSVRSSVSLGLYYDNTLVGVTCFTRRGDTYELTRHATSKRVIGALGKTVKFFGKDCYTFCDLSRYSGGSYLKAGFIKSDEIDPDYKYIVNGKREHKFLWRRGSIKSKRPDVYSEDLSEREMMEKAEYPRIWDCGKVRYCYVHKNERGRNEKHKW